MTWNIEQLQNRFNLRQRIIEDDLRRMEKNINSNDKTYERFYDKQLGALNVYIILETTETLGSPQRFVQKLKEMRSETPTIGHRAFQEDGVVSGWQKTLDKLIKEFELYL